MRRLMAILVMAATVFSCRGRTDYVSYTHDPLLYCKVVKKLNEVVLYNTFPPMIASRNYAYANIAAYECMAAGDSNFHSLSGVIRHLPPMPRPAKDQLVDYPLAALLAFVKVGNAVTFPEGVLMSYYDDIREGARKRGMPRQLLQHTVAFSDSVAARIMAWSKKDNYAQTRTAEKYRLAVEEGRWIPTPPAYMPATEPHWNMVRPLLLDSSSQFMPPLPPQYNMKDTASEYCRQAMEVKKVGEGLTPEQKHIADFFDDNPFNLHVAGHINYSTKKFSPAGHWMNIVGIACEKSKADFSTTVAAYAATAIALFDGFIACWDAKYKVNTVRPETVINKYLDANWQPYIQTPPFPSYVSGHSVISSASAEVLSYFFGDHFSYTDTSELEFGIPNRSFASFRDAALEASWSRLYGGIHFRADLENGNDMGRRIGAYIVQRLQMKKDEPTLSMNQ